MKDSKLDRMNPRSYCPVVLLPVELKIIERVVFIQVVEHMNSHGLLHLNHHGFRAHHSVPTAILQMMDAGRWSGSS